MNIDLTGKVALITGASQGLGKAMARRFALSGANVALLARTLETLDAAQQEIAAESGREIRGYVCDVSNATALDETYKTVEKDFKAVDILVNNAGSSARNNIEDVSRAALFSDIELKLASALRLSQLAIPGMRARRWGRIVNVVNIGGKAPKASSAPTSVTRAAGIALTKTMAGELAKDNILVNALCVGSIRSEQWVKRHRRDYSHISYEEYLRQCSTGIPLGRMGEPDEFAQIACFLVSDLASYITGTAINVDGGSSPVA